jgi:hypothetical protein
MATNATLDREAVLAARQGLLATESGGFGNMLNKELMDWFGTRRWIVQTIVWLAIVNGLMAFIMFIVPTMDPHRKRWERSKCWRWLSAFTSIS